MIEYINFNGEIIEKDNFCLELSNRAFRFGDSIFETIRVFDGEVIFIDDHYSRLISSLKIVKINIPDYFTKDYLNSEIINLLDSYNSFPNARVRLTVFRKSNSSIYFVDADTSFDFVIEAGSLENNNFGEVVDNYEIDIFEDIKKSKGILSQIKTNNVLLHSIAGSVAIEKSINNIVLLNDDDCITEAVNANIFIVKDENIYTPKLTDGCVEGIMRKKIIEIIETQTDLKIQVKSIYKDELLNCDEVFITNSIIGLQTVDRFRNVVYSKKISTQIRQLLIRNINSLLGQQAS